jgi:hypothetical protein
MRSGGSVSELLKWPGGGAQLLHRSNLKEPTIMNTFKHIALALAVAAVPTTAFAQEPAQNVSRYRHGNLAAAQDLARQAYDRVSAAQQANEFDLGGHAARAKQLLEQVNGEIKQAAEAANHR